MTEPDVSALVDELRSFAEFQTSQLSEQAKEFRAESSALHRWILASLLSVNGAAAISVFASDALTNQTKLLACSSFGTGSTLSIVYALAASHAFSKAAINISRSVEFFQQVSSGVVLDGAKLTEITKNLIKLKPLIFIAEWVSYFSLAAFVFGVLAVGTSLK